MADRLKGKLAFCTASGAGIGRATAIAFAREGARVIATDIDAAALETLKGEGIAETRTLDVRDTAAVNALASHHRCAGSTPTRSSPIPVSDRVPRVRRSPTSAWRRPVRACASPCSGQSRAISVSRERGAGGWTAAR